MPKVWNFIEKETLAKVFACEFYEICKKSFFTEHLWTTTSENTCNFTLFAYLFEDEDARSFNLLF